MECIFFFLYLYSLKRSFKSCDNNGFECRFYSLTSVKFLSFGSFSTVSVVVCLVSPFSTGFSKPLVPSGWCFPVLQHLGTVHVIMSNILSVMMNLVAFL